MRDVLLGAAALACPIGMGVMMWVMTKGMRRDDTQTPRPSIDALRDEHRRLGEEIESIEAGDAVAPR